MANQVTIIKQPLFGSVYWDGVNFIYTANVGFVGRDYYIYSITDGNDFRTYTRYVDTTNTSPTTDNISLTANNTELVTIDVTPFGSDPENNPLKLDAITQPLYGKAYIKGANLIQYQSYGFNTTDSFNYTITDGQYESTAQISIKTINGLDFDFPPYIKDEIDTLYLGISSQLLSSVNWNTAYTILCGSSAKWNNLNPDRYNAASSVVESNSANWNTVVSKSVSYDLAYNILTSSSSNWNNSDDVLNSITSLLSPTSSNWNQTYSILSSNSAYWNTGVTGYNLVFNLLNSNSANWQSLYNTVSNNSAFWDATNLTNLISSKSGNWENSYNLINTNSAVWNNAISNFNSLNSFVNSNSGDWYSAYTTVCGNSAKWDNTAITTALYSNSAAWNFTYTTLTANSASWNGSTNNINSLITNFSNSSGNWNAAETYVRANSAGWGDTSGYNLLSSNSAYWNSAYNTVSSTSGTWNAVATVYGKYDIAYNSLTANSGTWNSYYNTITSNSGSWDNTYNIILQNSAKWLSGSSTQDFVTNNLTAYGNAVFYGNLTANGASTYLQTDVKATSSFSIVNTGIVNALNVNKTQTTGAIASFNYNNSPVLYISPIGRVGVNTSTPNAAFTVVGDISASGTIYGQIPDSFTAFQKVSARYETAYNYVTGVSSTVNTLTSQKTNYDNAYTYVNANSASINTLSVSANTFLAAYNIAASQSAANNTTYTFLTANSGKVGVDNVFRNNVQSYNDAITYVNAATASVATINIIFDGGGKALVVDTDNNIIPNTTVQIPYDITLLGWVLLSDNITTSTVSILSSNLSNYPTLTEITPPANYMSISNAIKSNSDVLTNWVTTIPANTFLNFKLKSNSGSGNLTVMLKCKRKL